MAIFTMVRSQSEPCVREPVWRPRTSLMTQKNILKITIRSKNLIVQFVPTECVRKEKCVGGGMSHRPPIGLRARLFSSF